jgi:hypothetical protein
MPNSIEATWGWAPGSEPLLLPEEAGFMVGEESAQTHYALQIHYNNPLEEPGHIDSSGVDLYLTDEIRPYAAGGFVLGNVGGLTIPPGESAYEVVGNCDTTASVTAPINVFASMVHAHELGRRIWTDHLRDGTRMGDLGRADPYSFNNQGFAPLDIVIEPGDELVTHCVYDSTSRTEPTGFGFGTRDEMCFNYLLVYPRVSQPYCLN